MNKLLVIVGPTAVGKTALSIEAAKRFGGEVVSGDSMQVYRKLDIGTAKVTKDEMQDIPHHMIDIVDPTDRFTVADFAKKAKEAIASIQSRGKLPILVGGSGLYVQSILYHYDFLEHKRDEKVTKQLENELKVHGIDYLYEKLQAIDPDQAAKIHKNNTRRVIRALEIYYSTNQTMTSYIQARESSKRANYDSLIIGLDMDRELLYERINERVDRMVDRGLIDEVASLYENNLLQSDSLQAIGYKEMIPYVNKEQTKQEAIDLLKRNSRRFAKRQFTWFRNQLDVHWHQIDPNHYEAHFEVILHEIEGFLKEV